MEYESILAQAFAVLHLETGEQCDWSIIEALCEGIFC
jgi:hypothetical protein